MRVLSQDPWECLVSYICSKATPILRTRRVVKALADDLGDKLQLAGKTRCTFPAPAVLADIGTERLQEMKLGFRFPKEQPKDIVAAALRILEGKLDWETLLERPYSEVICELTKMGGVHYKVANCTALMALEKTEAFPVDTWVKKAVQCWYEGFPTPNRWDYPSKRHHDAMVRWAFDRFGAYAGYAGQYLFHGINPNKT